MIVGIQCAHCNLTLCNSPTVIINRVVSICVRKCLLTVSNDSETVRRIDGAVNGMGSNIRVRIFQIFFVVKKS